MPSLVKEVITKEIMGEFEKNPYAFFSRVEAGLPVAELSEFRRMTEKVAGRSLMIKHSLAKRVFAERNWQEAEKFLSGQILVTYGSKEPQTISKAIVKFAKVNSKLLPKGVIYEGKIYGEEFIKRLADLPSHKELMTQVVVRIKSPISGLVLTLNGLVRGLVVALNEIKNRREAQPKTA